MKTIEDLKIHKEDKPKEAFYCSEYGKCPLDLYWKFKGEPETDPMEWYAMPRLGAGKGAEVELLKLLKDNGIVAQDYSQEEHGRVDMIRENIVIHGYIDAIAGGDLADEFGIEKGSPIEIKTINNKNAWDIKRYEAGNPRENYVAQLGMYMDFLGKNKGYLFVVSLDGLSRFLFECSKIRDGVYKCGNTEVDISQEYKRWSVLYHEYILKDRIPEWNVRYKIPVNEVDWASMETAKIKKALENQAIIGDEDKWQIDYSPYKTKILQLQGATLGYTDQELKDIRTLSGYDIINNRMTKRK